MNFSKVHVRLDIIVDLYFAYTRQVTEIVSKIKAKSELDCKARDIITIEDGDLDFGAAFDKFVSILKGDPGCNKVKG